MSAAPVLTASELRAAGRVLATPFRVILAAGDELCVERLLRVLPGKRVVVAGRWRGQAVLAKLFVAEDSMRHWQRERDGLAALAAAAIPTPALLQAETLPGRGHVLLTAWLDGATTLAEEWGVCPDASPGGAQDLLCDAAAALGRLHATGLVHDDAHLGNFLRHAGMLYVIDGDAVRSVSAADTVSLLANLALLLAQLPPAWDAHWEPLLAAYQGASGRAVPASDLVLRVKACRQRRLNDYLAKIGRDCTLFATRKDFSCFAVVARAQAEALAPLLADPDAAVVAGACLKDGRTCSVARVEDVRAGPLVVKRYNLKNVWHALGRCWRPSRAWHSWREGHRLRFYGIATPEPLAIVEERFGLLRRRAFLINALCPGRDLLALLSPDAEPPDEMGAALMSFFSALHALRISHGDFKATNLLWHAGQVVVIDLDAMTQHRSAQAYAKAWRRDRARFLRNWPADSALVRWFDTRLPPA